MRKLIFFVAFAIFPLISRATNITLQGSFSADDNIQLFAVSLAAPATVDIRSYGYAGGTTSTGAVVPRGGFDTILTLFSASGVFIDDNDDGAGVAIDPTTGQAADARITANLAAGSYILAVTEYDNFSIGNLSDGFAETGNHNFTADPNFASGGACPGGLFRDISGTAGRCRSGNWALDFGNVTSVTSVPEPGTVALFGVGLLGFALVLRRKRRAAIAVPVLLAAVLSTSVRAQGPDYSNVNDFLNGKRLFLAIDDVVAAGITPGAQPDDLSQLSSSTLPSANSQLNPPTNQTSLATPSDAKVKALTTHMLNSASSTPLELIWSTTAGSNLYFPSLGNAANVPFFDPPSLSAAGGAAADFNQDGVDEVVLNYSNGETVVGTNLKTNADGSVSLTYGPISTLDALADMAIGDFNGDGRPEIAGLVTLPSGGLEIVIYTVDPTTLAVSSAAHITLQKTLTFELGQSFSMTAGRFASINHDQIVVAAGGFVHDSPNGGDWLTRLALIDFPPSSLMPQESTTDDIFSIPFPLIKVRAGRFGVPGNFYQQVVYGSLGSTAVNGFGSGYILDLLSVDPSTFAWTRPNGYNSPGSDCAYDMVVGNFDNQQADPATPGQRQHNLNDQIAVTHGACGSGTRGIDILFKAATSAFQLGVASTTNLPSSFNNVGSISITPSDTQGRSLLLGQPTKVTISQPVQPSVVIGAPPMHVDWVSPDPLDGVPAQVMNLSAVPDGFNTTYDVENTAEQQSGTTNSTSWSLGTKTSVGGFIQFGDPDVAGIKVSDMSTAAQELKNTAQQENGSYTRNTYNIYQATGFGDQVSYTDSDFNIWVYPVIGRTVCPAATPNCSTDQKVPLTIQFSAPNGNATSQTDQGQSLQWYQPPWEPGNIFSYPANFDQLQSIYGNLAKLTTDGTEFLTDTSRVTQKTTWAVGTNSSQTASVEQNYSSENDFSAEASASFLDIGGGASVGYDVSGSNGFSNLSKSSSDLGTSTGISISKPGTFPSFDLYGYSVSPYILGTAKPGGLVDNQPLSTDVQTFGLIRGLFTADPLTSNSGGWWQQAYSQGPDVALNHPSRWQVVFQGLTSPVPPNCLTTGTGASQMDCTELSFKAPKNPWLSSFHQMRGFFISNANSPGQGPQLEQAKAGDVLTLQARVYNYSLAPMPDGSKVHVRFYFQPWKGTAPVGDSVLIGEPELDPIPPFNDVTGAPSNWVLASTTFDTSKYDQTKAGDVHVAFWVVVWIQTGNAIVPEMPDHGLTGIPGSLNSLNDAAQLEQIASDKNSYDNNVGFFKQAFYIGQVTPGLGAPPPAARGLIEVGKVDVSARSLTPHDTIAVSATLSTSGAPVSGITAVFYDGDPQQGGRRFGVERVPYIAADTSYDVATTYRTNACATHQLFVVLNEGKAGEIVRRAPPVRVDCK